MVIGLSSIGSTVSVGSFVTSNEKLDGIPDRATLEIAIEAVIYVDAGANLDANGRAPPLRRGC